MKKNKKLQYFKDDAPLKKLKEDFNISYSEMASLFGYKQGYIYKYSHSSKEFVPLPLQKFCEFYRKIKLLEKELQNFNILKCLFKEILKTDKNASI